MNTLLAAVLVSNKIPFLAKKTCSMKMNRASCNRVEINDDNMNDVELKRNVLLRRSQGAAILDDTNYLPRITKL